MKNLFQRFAVFTVLFSLLVPVFSSAHTDAELNANGELEMKIAKGGGLSMGELILSGSAKIESTDADSITVRDQNDAVVRLETDDDTIYSYQDGRTDRENFLPGDRVVVFARMNLSGEWRILRIRNQSIRNATITGTITEVNASSFFMESRSGKVYDVLFDPDMDVIIAKNRNRVDTNYLEEGMRVTVRGRLFARTNIMNDLIFILVRSTP